MDEVWKDIIGYEGNYQISNFGRLKGKDRYACVNGGGKKFIGEKILKPIVCTNGYLEASLCKDGKRKVYLLHRLVAIHFLENPNNYPEINHKDENIKNCRVDNLEWCTSKYNANYGTRNERVREKNKWQQKPVVKIDMDGKVIERFDCIADASRNTGGDMSQIIRVCNGEQETCGGYIWKYLDDIGDSGKIHTPELTNSLWRIKRGQIGKVSLPDNIKRIRKDKGINQTELANMIGIKQSTMSGIESGRKLPSYNTIIKIASVLDVDFTELVPEIRENISA